MNRNIKTLAIGLGLAGLLTGCSPKLEREIVLTEGNFGENRARVVKEIISWGSDAYRLEVYDGAGVCRVQARSRMDLPYFILSYDGAHVSLGLEQASTTE